VAAAIKFVWGKSLQCFHPPRGLEPFTLFLQGALIMKFKGDFLGAPSGSVGGLVFSHNRYGYYCRKKVIPTNPNTSLQQAVRAIFGQLAAAWSNTLTASQRAAWELYAANVPVLNNLGDPQTLSGNAMYIRCNTPRLQAGLTAMSDGPTIFTLDEFTAPNFTLDGAGAQIEVSFTNTDDWANEVGGAMLVWQGKPQGIGRTFFKGPFRYAGKIAGAAVAPESPVDIATPPFTLNADNLGWIKVATVRADGRISQSLILGPEAVE
jgi:hypothetical protein